MSESWSFECIWNGQTRHDPDWAIHIFQSEMVQRNSRNSKSCLIFHVSSRFFRWFSDDLPHKTLRWRSRWGSGWRWSETTWPRPKMSSLGEWNIRLVNWDYLYWYIYIYNYIYIGTIFYLCVPLLTIYRYYLWCCILLCTIYIGITSWPGGGFCSIDESGGDNPPRKG